MDTNEPHSTTPPPYYQDDEITLKELILKIQEYYQKVMTHWKMVVIGGVVMGAIFLTKALLEDTTYTATLTFMVNEDEGGRAGGAIAGLLGQFGFSTGATGKYNLPKILELSRSRRIVQEALMERVNIDGQMDYLANHIIRLYEYHDQWEDIEDLQNFLFKADSVEIFKESENKALKSIYSQVVGDPDNKIEGLLSTSFGEETAIMKLSVKSISEILSIEIANVIYEKLSLFYIQKSTEKQEQTYRLMKSKADSLLSLANNRQMQLLKFNDTYRSLPLQQYSAKRLELERDVQIFTIAYGEAIKNVEIADFAFKNATPFFQIIDWPIPPLKGSFSIINLLKTIIVGGIFGSFILIVYLIIKNAVNNAMN